MRLTSDRELWKPVAEPLKINERCEQRGHLHVRTINKVANEVFQKWKWLPVELLLNLREGLLDRRVRRSGQTKSIGGIVGHVDDASGLVGDV